MDKPLSRFAKVVYWFVALNALVGALSLMLFPADTEVLFFWEIRPPINAALFGALYLGGALVVGYATWRGWWEPSRFLVPVLVSAGILISVTTLLPTPKYSDAAGMVDFYDRASARLRALPGVESVALTSIVPISGNDEIYSLAFEGRPPFPPGQGVSALYYLVDAGYFQTMGIPVL